MTNKILMLTETDRALLGLDTGSGPLSGRALKFMLLRTLGKVNRKRLYYTTAIPRILGVAAQLEGMKDPPRVMVKWPDGLPQDREEMLDEVDRRLANKTLSRKGAIKMLDNVDESGADEKLGEIDGEDEAEMDAIRNTVQARQAPVLRAKVDRLDEEL